jgi:DNA-binding GntR family transcriptional regulator
MAHLRKRYPPQYRKLYELLRRQIVQGAFAPGDLLPSESQLKQTHHLSQPTVRRAVELLEEEGLVKRHQGKGSVVQTRPPGVGIISFDGDRFTSQTDSPRIRTRLVSEIRRIEGLPSDFGFAAPEGAPEQGWYCLERERRIEDYILFHEKLCLPCLEGFSDLKLENVSLYETLFLRYQLLIRASEQRFWATAADATLAAKLEVPEGSPVQRLQRRFTTSRDDFYIYSDLSARTDHVYLFSQST